MMKKNSGVFFFIFIIFYEKISIIIIKILPIISFLINN